jgi:hypothetical protein
MDFQARLAKKIDLISKITSAKKGWRCDSNDREPAYKHKTLSSNHSPAKIIKPIIKQIKQE